MSNFKRSSPRPDLLPGLVPGLVFPHSKLMLPIRVKCMSLRENLSHLFIFFDNGMKFSNIFYQNAEYVPPMARSVRKGELMEKWKCDKGKVVFSAFYRSIHSSCKWTGSFTSSLSPVTIHHSRIISQCCCVALHWTLHSLKHHLCHV